MVANYFSEKLQNYIDEVFYAIDYLSKNEVDIAFTWFRKSGEACMKAIIYAQKGDIVGHEIITGKKNRGGSYQYSSNSMSYNELLEYCKSEKYIENDLREKLYTIKVICSPSAHDPNEKPIEKTPEKILVISKEITHLLFSNNTGALTF